MIFKASSFNFPPFLFFLSPAGHSSNVCNLFHVGPAGRYQCPSCCIPQGHVLFERSLLFSICYLELKAYFSISTRAT